jgi:hypothetical protein
VIFTAVILFLLSLLPSLEVALDDLLRNFKSANARFATSNRNQSSYSKRRRIHSMEVVSRKTIYGMYLEEFLFIKVNVYDPNDIKRIVNILEVCSCVTRSRLDRTSDTHHALYVV